jgi:transglutaminase-like putative cysteine protease
VLELEVIHETRYDYAAPVTLAHHLAHLQPLQDGAQRLLGFDLSVTPAADRLRHGVDAAGNAVCHFSLIRPHTTLTVRATSRVRVAPRFAALQPETSPPWDALAESLQYVARSRFEPAVEYALPSPFVPRLEALRSYGAATLTPGRPVAEAAIELMQRIHADFKYDGDSTEIDTPLAQAFEQRRGVCQDFAHLMAGTLRMSGLPARYVSGYLLTQAAEGGAPLLGADASHAWVQVWCPGTAGVADGWLDLDPTNDLIPGTGHVRLAVGRDFGDVTPLRGVIRGGGRHTLTVGVTTRVVGPVGPAGPVVARSPIRGAKDCDEAQLR